MKYQCVIPEEDKLRMIAHAAYFCIQLLHKISVCYSMKKTGLEGKLRMRHTGHDMTYANIL